MERKLASIQKILDIQPIEGAENIEVATVLGWKTVITKGQFNIGDLCVFVEVDSILPRRDWNEFLFKHDDAKLDFRLRTIRLRKQISQGCAFPLDILGLCDGVDLFPQEGEDWTDRLGIKKYEPYVPAQLRGEVEGLRPHFVPKTDETRIQSCPKVLGRHNGKQFYITEKVDGTSASFYFKDGKFGVCSRNLELKENKGNTYWDIANELDEKANASLKDKLITLGRNIIIQGEIYGAGVNENKYKMGNRKFAAYNVYDIDSNKYFSYKEFVDFCNQLHINPVPLLYSPVQFDGATVDEMISLSMGNSLINTEILREGIVVRSIQEDLDEDLGRLSFKVINPEFEIKYKNK